MSESGNEHEKNPAAVELGRRGGSRKSELQLEASMRNLNKAWESRRKYHTPEQRAEQSRRAAEARAVKRRAAKAEADAAALAASHS